MEYKDYYKVMGLNKDAQPSDIKLAYRKLARKYHPDINKEPDAEEKFKELGEAYEVLKDPEKRKAYDQYGRDYELHQKTRASGSQQRNTSNTSYQFDSDFFESLFGDRARQQHNRQGQDYNSSVRISLEDAYKGVVKELHLSAAKPGAKEKAQTLRVKIPAGVKSGQQIRLAGQGAPGIGGGPKGDLYLTIYVDKHPLFDVKGNDIYLTLPVTPWEAVLGSTIVVPTLGGNVDLKIQPDSQGGQTLRLKKRGLPGTQQGDQYIILKMVTPPAITENEKAIYKKMAEDMPFNPREKMGL